MIIEIIQAPNGASPQWVREAWIGAKLRTVQEGVTTMQTLSAVNSAKSRFGQMLQIARKQTEMRTGYLVNAKDALGVLSLQNEEAARWCIENTPQMLNPEQVFLFDQHACKPLSAD